MMQTEWPEEYQVAIQLVSAPAGRREVSFRTSREVCVTNSPPPPFTYSFLSGPW